MNTTDGLKGDLAFTGGASNFGDIDLSVGALQSIARRQLVGSIVIICGIGIAAVLVAICPSRSHSASNSTVPAVSQSHFVASVHDNIPTIKQRNSELP
jgi:hypothetical protein